MANKDAPLAVEVPASDREKPGWVKVGVIAAVGFVVGVAWPRVLGVRLGPSAPGEAAAAAAAAASNTAQAGRAPEAPPATVVAKAPASAAPAASAPPAPPAAAPAATNANAKVAPTITVGKGAVLSCKTADGETKKGAKECGGLPGLDQVVAPRIRKIATCSGAEGQSGKLSVVVNADFASKKVSFDVGKSSTIQNPDAIASCLKTTFQGATAASTPHEHSRYTVAYTAHLGPGKETDAGDKAAAVKGDKSETSDKGDKDRSEKSAKQAPEKEVKPSDAPPLASGEAQVAWEVALVREAPKTGNLVSRLPRGTRVKIGTSKDGWYLIKFGEGYAHEGWVYRGAIGR